MANNEKKTFKFNLEKIILSFQSSSFGPLKFKYISVKDLGFFQKLLNQKLSNKDFSLKLLYNQLETEIDFNKFSKIDEQELRNIIFNYVKKSKLIYPHYLNIQSGNIYYKLKKSVQLCLDKQRTIEKTVFEHLEATRKIIEQSTLPKLIRMVFPKIEIPRFMPSDVSKQLKVFNNSFFKTIKKHSKIWQNFAVQYKKISKKSLRNLKKYNWFINKSMPAPFIAEPAEIHNAKQMKELFINYHLYENCKVLDEYLSTWKANPLFKKRIKILSDTIKLFRNNINNKTVNINNVVIPVLINQIEGLRQDYLKSKGIIHLGKNSWQDPKTKKTVKWDNFYKDALKNKDEFTKLIFDIFSGILYQQDNKKAPIINFSRHKISHGLNTRYGTIETTIRCFMIIDFISDLE